MDIKQIESIINLYKMTNKLKTTLRSGWIGWKLENTRIESVAEHIFGTCMLAVGICSAKKIDIDINKVITMLVLHETEEIIIGDLTLFDKEISNKKENGRKAVLEIFKDFDNADYFLELIAEFEDGKTKEAQFAFQCDKLEADLQCALYNNNFNLEKVDSFIINDKRIKALQEQGYNSVAEWFLQHDKPLYKDEFLKIANYLENNKI